MQSVSPVAYAPATYRVVADVANAEHCVWDYGDGRMEVTDGGKIDRMVTFDKPGTFPLQVVAFNGKQAVKQAGAVKIEAHRPASVTAVLKVIDSGHQLMRKVRNESVTIPVPTGKNPPPNFSKSVHIRPGYALTEAVMVKPTVAGREEPEDRGRSRQALGAGSGRMGGRSKVGRKAAGGSDVIVPVKLTEERVSPHAPAIDDGHRHNRRRGGAARLRVAPATGRLGLAAASASIRSKSVNPARDGKDVVALQVPADWRGSVTFPWSGKVSGRAGRSPTPRHWLAIRSSSRRNRAVLVRTVSCLFSCEPGAQRPEGAPVAYAPGSPIITSDRPFG